MLLYGPAVLPLYAAKNICLRDDTATIFPTVCFRRVDVYTEKISLVAFATKLLSSHLSGSVDMHSKFMSSRADIKS